VSSGTRGGWSRGSCVQRHARRAQVGPNLAHGCGEAGRVWCRCRRLQAYTDTREASWPSAGGMASSWLGHGHRSRQRCASSRSRLWEATDPTCQDRQWIASGQRKPITAAGSHGSHCQDRQWIASGQRKPITAAGSHGSHCQDRQWIAAGQRRGREGTARPASVAPSGTHPTSAALSAS
jgi:hypothetical protein